MTIVLSYSIIPNENKLGGSKLSFKPIPVEKKIETVSRVIAGQKIQPVAREIGVHRSSIYISKETAFAALERA